MGWVWIFSGTTQYSLLVISMTNWAAMEACNYTINYDLSILNHPITLQQASTLHSQSIKVFVLPPPPPRNPSLASYFASKVFAFQISPPPGNFLMTSHGVGMDFFWNYTIFTFSNKYDQLGSHGSMQLHYQL